MVYESFQENVEARVRAEGVKVSRTLTAPYFAGGMYTKCQHSLPCMLPILQPSCARIALINNLHIQRPTSKVL